MNGREFSRYETQPKQAGVHVYRLKSLGYGTSRFGPCEVCKTPVSETFLQVEGVTFEFDAKINVTRHDCKDLFGHKECLMKARR